MTDGRGPDSVIDAVGMEAHGSPAARFAQQVAGLLPDAVAAPLMKTAGVDRLNALYSAIDIVRRGGTISLIGVYGGMADPMPMLTLFDKQIQLRMGQANVKRGSTTSCRCSPTTTRSASTRSPPTGSRSTTPPARTRCSRRSRRGGQGGPQALTARYPAPMAVIGAGTCGAAPRIGRPWWSTPPSTPGPGPRGPAGIGPRRLAAFLRERARELVDGGELVLGGRHLDARRALRRRGPVRDGHRARGREMVDEGALRPRESRTRIFYPAWNRTMDGVDRSPLSAEGAASRCSTARSRPPTTPRTTAESLRRRGARRRLPAVRPRDDRAAVLPLARRRPHARRSGPRRVGGLLRSGLHGTGSPPTRPRPLCRWHVMAPAPPPPPPVSTGAPTSGWRALDHRQRACWPAR